MKKLIAAVLSVAILIGGWMIFADYSHARINEFACFIEEEILPAVEASDWETSCILTEKLDKDWQSYRSKAIFFLDTQKINEIDCSMAKSIKYVKAEDVSNSSGELNAMTRQLTFLYANDEVNWGNVF